MENTTRDHLTELSTWTRMVFIVLFAIVFNFVELLVAGIVAIQFVSQLCTGRTVPRLQEQGKVLAKYVHEIVLFLTYQTDQRPYPFSAMPEAKVEAEPAPGC